MFVDREAELETLGRMAREKGARLVILYGRRRVGKTELLREFCRHRRSVFFVADQRPAYLQLNDFSAALWEGVGENRENAPVFPDWAEALKYAGKIADRRRVVLVVDEFPYLALSDRSLPSVLQRVWDSELSRSQLLLILCGSAVSYMEGEVLSEKSPLFGRRGGQMLLEPLGLPEAAGFWKGWKPEDAIRAYAVVGGVPAYAARLNPRQTLGENIRREILDKNAYLFEEVPYLLMQELREPRLYLAILEAMAAGRGTQNEIAQAIGMRSSQVMPYLRSLIGLRLVERTIPVQEKHPHKSRKGRYRIRDPFLRFWFRFVFPNRSQLEQGLARQVWIDRISPFLDEYVSLVFEDLARDHLWHLARTGKLPFTPARIGPWWEAREEVEVVAVSQRSDDILVAECKWTRRPVGLGVLGTLKSRADVVRRSMSAHHTHLALFSRSGFHPDVVRKARSERVLLFKPQDLVLG